MDNLVVAVDFDGTICHSDYPNVDNLDYRMIDLLKQLQEKGAHLILFTCRHNEPLEDAKEALKKQGLIFDAYNENLDYRIEKYGECRKIGANIYIDDRDICHDYYKMIYLLQQLVENYDEIKNQYVKREILNINQTNIKLNKGE